jgi:hypothetical protein
LQNSITRYCKNNFLDGQRQDSFDLFLGNFKVGQDTSVNQASAEEKALRVRVVSILDIKEGFRKTLVFY